MKTKEEIASEWAGIKLEIFTDTTDLKYIHPYVTPKQCLLAMEAYAQQQVKNLNIPDVSNRREQLIAFAQWLAHEEEYGKDGAIGTVDAYLESN
jgi:hypothetical protein